MCQAAKKVHEWIEKITDTPSKKVLFGKSEPKFEILWLWKRSTLIKLENGSFGILLLANFFGAQNFLSYRSEVNFRKRCLLWITLTVNSARVSWRLSVVASIWATLFQSSDTEWVSEVINYSISSVQTKRRWRRGRDGCTSQYFGTISLWREMVVFSRKTNIELRHQKKGLFICYAIFFCQIYVQSLINSRIPESTHAVCKLTACFSS